MIGSVASVSILRLGILASFLLGILTGCATPTNSECNPENDSFINSFQCRDQYADRQEKLKAEVQAAASRSTQNEEELASLESRRVEMQASLDQVQQQLDKSEQRISSLRESNGATESELAALKIRWDEVQHETEELMRQQAVFENATQAGDIDSQISELRQREADLESLLLDLES